MARNGSRLRTEESRKPSKNIDIVTDRRTVQVIDSHTAGEPTRVVIRGGPDLGGGSLQEQLCSMRNDYDEFRRSIVLEPRGSDIIVGALLTEAGDPDSAAGIIFFNNVGYLGMCGHGLIGVVRTLEHLGRISPGTHAIETPVGKVQVKLSSDGRVSVTNVPACRLHSQVSVEVPEYGTVTGDVAWGGNWFFLADVEETLLFERIPQLMGYAHAIRKALERDGVSGSNGEPIDHIEISGPATTPAADSRNFVLCPGGAYDRSPCGTGTSAKIACLQADGRLSPGEVWRQESILGTVFEASYTIEDGMIIPTITGEAFITSESTLIFDHRDPFRWGIV